jgi:hypothetical protein
MIASNYTFIELGIKEFKEMKDTDITNVSEIVKDCETYSTKKAKLQNYISLNSLNSFIPNSNVPLSQAQALSVHYHYPLP